MRILREHEEKGSREVLDGCCCTSSYATARITVLDQGRPCRDWLNNAQASRHDKLRHNIGLRLTGQCHVHCSGDEAEVEG